MAWGSWKPKLTLTIFLPDDQGEWKCFCIPALFSLSFSLNWNLSSVL